MKNLLAAGAACLLLAACVADRAPPRSHSDAAPPPKLMLDVQSISLADRSGIQPFGSPYNTNHFTPTIGQAIKQWAGDRLQAVGSGGQAIIVIKDASLTSQALPVTHGFDEMFTRQQTIKYTGHADVSVEASGRQGFATTEATATRSVTLPEHPSSIEKQDAYFTMLNDLMRDLGQNLETGIASHMGNFVTGQPSAAATVAPMAMQVQPMATPLPNAYDPPAPPQIPSTPLLTTVSEKAPMPPQGGMGGSGDASYPSMANGAPSAAPIPLVTQAPPSQAVAFQAPAATDYMGHAPLTTINDSAAKQMPPPTPIAPQPFSGYTDATYPNAAKLSGGATGPATIPLSQSGSL